MCEDHIDSEAEEERDRENYKRTESEDENKEGTDIDEAEDGIGCIQDKEDDDEDYDEVVVKPRPLNEVTSLTDKTSPWTSILSDPDLVSLESMEAQEEPSPRQDEGKKWMLNLQSPNSSGQHEHGEQDENGRFSASTGNTSGTDSDDERTLQALEERQGNEASSPNELSDGKDSSLITQDTADTHDASCSLVNQDSPPQAYP